MISAKIVADSLNEFGDRLTTMEVVFPRFILAELNTHRMFSRNSASSRAIPFEKMVKSVQENPFIPIAWQKDHKGMQGIEYLDADLNGDNHLRSEWLMAKDSAIKHARNLSKSDVTKQLCNRLLEPFMWHKVLITATEWNNFFNLRCPQYQIGQSPIFKSKTDLLQYFSDDPSYSDLLSTYKKLDWLKCNTGQAEIHMMALAEAIYDAINESTPKKLSAGEWHIPYGDDLNEDELHKLSSYKADYGGVHSSEITDYLREQNELKIKIATARCAQVSYTVVGDDQKPMDYAKLIALHDRLLKSGHMSPFEHIGCAMESSRYDNPLSSPWSGNFKGFVQYRKTIE